MPKKQQSGLYRTKVKIGVAPDGKDIVKWVSGKTVRELENAKRRVIEHYITGQAVAQDCLFGDYAVAWYHTRKEPFVSPSTRNNYRTMLNRYLIPTFGKQNMRAISTNDLQAFVNQFSGESKSQITSALCTVQQIFAAATQDGLLHRNPSTGLQRPVATPPTSRRALTDAERERILDAIECHKYGAYLAVLFYTGMRPGEVRGLQWGDFDWDGDMVTVQRDVDYATGAASLGALKTAKAYRKIPIAQPLRDKLFPLRGNPDVLVFPGIDGRPMAQVTAIRMWIELMVSCGMAVTIDGPTCYGAGDIRGQYRPTITPYTMRHNFITMCWEQGLDVLVTREIVGHADYQTTMNIYTHLSNKHLEKAQQDLNAMFTAKKESCTKVAPIPAAKTTGKKKSPKSQ